MDQRQGEFCVDNSSTAKHMTYNLAGLEDYKSASARKRVEDAGSIVLSIVKYGRLRLLVDLVDLVDQAVGNCKGPMRELALERITHVSNLGLHYILSMKRLANLFVAPKRFYPPPPSSTPSMGATRPPSDLFFWILFIILCRH